MSDTTSPEFSDAQVKAYEAPAQSQGESPRNVDTNQTPSFSNSEEGQLAAFEQWKRDREAERLANDKNRTETPVKTGRGTAPTETTKSEAPVRKEADEVKPQSYVWLANGEVVRANNEDLPGSAGHGNAFGHWQKDGKVHTIVAVYDVEENAEN